MSAAVRDSISAITSAASITVDPSTLTYQANDVLVLFVWGYGTLGAPSGSDLTWTQQASDSIIGPFSNTDSMKVFTAVADASITSFTVSNGLTDQIGYALVSVSGANTSTPVDAVGTAKNTFNTVPEPTAPSVSPAAADSLLLCGCGVWPGEDSASSFLPPTGMTELEDFEAWDSYSVAALALSASGATGAKVFTETPIGTGTTTWIAASIAIRSSGSGDAHNRTISRVVSTHTG